MKRLTVLSTVALAVSVGTYGQTSIEIALKQGSPSEIQTKEQLQRLLAIYDVSPWIYTKSILVDERSLPHSHPVLTLHTRHVKDDELLLSTFVHEQLHWFLYSSQATQEAITELRKLLPKVPVGYPDGAADEESTYLHLLVCYLEHQANLRLLGELKARQVIEFWATDHYRWVYRTVLERSRDIGNVVRNHKLIPTR